MSKRLAKKSRWPGIRGIFNKVHLWLGLASGLIVFVVCLSGTIYVFNTELIEWSAPHLYKVSYEKGMVKQSPDVFRPVVETESGGVVTRVVIPAAVDKPYQFNVKIEGDNSRGGVGYMVNPYTGKIMGTTAEELPMRTFMGYMFSLHRWLLLDRIEQPIVQGKTNLELGRMINGWATIIFTLGCLTGIVIWFPNRVKSWRQGLKVKTNAGWKRINHDLHNSLAFYSVFFLLIMGLTGPQWSFKWYRTGMQKALGTYKEAPAPGTPAAKEIKEIVQSNTYHLLLLQEYMRIADEVLPYEGNYSISIPGETDEATTVSKTKTGFFAPAASDKVVIDKYTGTIKETVVFRDKPFNERVAGSIKALHVGNVFGSFTKWIYFFTCLIATSLPVTGTLIWVNKLKKKRRKTVTSELRKLQHA